MIFALNYLKIRELVFTPRFLWRYAPLRSAT